MPPPTFRRGDVLTAETITDLYRRTEPPAVRASGGLTSRGDGRAIDLVGHAPLRFVGVAAENIPAASAAIGAWGTGTVTRLAFDGTAGYSTSQTYSVVNPSPATMSSGNGINSGQSVWVEEDSDGNLVVTPLECA